jgi:hypothetical protein
VLVKATDLLEWASAYGQVGTEAGRQKTELTGGGTHRWGGRYQVEAPEVEPTGDQIGPT